MQEGTKTRSIMARILIAEGNSLFREKMKQIITDNFLFTLIAEASSEDETLSELAQYAFDVLILDTDLSDGKGLNVLKKTRIMNPDIPVLVMSMFPNQQYEESVFREGARGYVSKANLSNELITALRQISRGENYFSFKETGIPGEKSR